MIATIDFEASSLAIQGEPIEVGIALWSRGGAVKTWSSLIYPVDDILWSPESAEIHGISWKELQAAPHPVRVAERLNRHMTNSRLAFCDGGAFDERWMAQLFIAGGVKPVFRLAPIEAMAGLDIDLVRHRLGNFWSQRRRRTGLEPMLFGSCAPMLTGWGKSRMSWISDVGAIGEAEYRA